MATNDLQQLDRGTAQGDQTGDTGFVGSGKIIANFNELDQRTKTSIPFRNIILNSDFTETVESVRITNALNNSSIRNIEARVAYLLIENRASATITGDIEIITRIYTLNTLLTFGDTIGRSLGGTVGSFQFDADNIEYQLLSQRSTPFVDGSPSGIAFLDVGSIGSVSISGAVNSQTDTTPVNIAPFIVTSNDGTDDNNYIYVGSRSSIGSGVTTTDDEFALIVPQSGGVTGGASNTSSLINDGANGTDIYVEFGDINAQNFTGTEIPLNRKTTFFNTLTAQSASAYTLSALKVLGADAKIWINTLTQPTITGAVQTGGVVWEANTDMDLIVQVEGGRIIYFFVTREIPS